MAKQDKRLYRVSFYNDGKVYEVYVRHVSSSNLLGFVELEDMVFGEKSKILVDPAEEKLYHEFENTKRTFIPMHSVMRIDEMKKDSSLKPRIVPLTGKDNANGKGSRVSPIYTTADPFPKK